MRFRSVRTLINDRLPAFRTIEHRAKAALAERTSALARIGEGMVMVIASFWV
ncbi:hypothetical protein [Mesorhizobium sp. M7A.F.Ca.CA.002.05.1.1]|uniref:hypothetical protein n=1 Tax=Mesorhizobium sp. M7A.F.Ca.CA.002.05.1.1 TaxID=2496704 RepID=UPI0019D1B883|nr:hypothetical protein [Mesorhizobium sp. M7A.F.Ca.CA.002.05.1.1]